MLIGCAPCTMQGCAPCTMQGWARLFLIVSFRSRMRAFNQMVLFLFLFSIVPLSFCSVPFHSIPSHSILSLRTIIPIRSVLGVLSQRTVPSNVPFLVKERFHPTFRSQSKNSSIQRSILSQEDWRGEGGQGGFTVEVSKTKVLQKRGC